MHGKAFGKERDRHRRSESASAGTIRKALAAEGAQVMIADINDGSGVAAEIAAKHGSNCHGELYRSTSATRRSARRWWPRPSSASARSTS